MPSGPDPKRQIEEAQWEEHRLRRERDSSTPPGPEAVEKTRAFLGDWRRALVILRRETTYGLGSLQLAVHGDGRVEADHEPFGTAKGHRAKGRLSEDAVKALFEAFVREAFSELFVGRHCGHPDEISLALHLRSAKGVTKAEHKFVLTEHRRFEALVAQVREAAAAFDAGTRKKLTL